MQHLRSAILAQALLVPLAIAQVSAPKPAPQLAKLAPLVGSWEGRGIVRHGPDGPEEAWTSRSSARWTLGGHFLREDVRIEMDSMPGALQFRTFYGWDREREQYVLIEVGNMGGASLSDLHWTPEGKMFVARTQSFGGVVVVERWVTTIGNGELSFEGQQAQADGPFFEHVRGTLKRRAEKPDELQLADAAFAPEPTAKVRAEIGRLLPTAGRYRMSGTWRPSPDRELTFSGTETVRPIFGGTLLEIASASDATADTPAYEGLAWLAWDDAAHCFTMTMLNDHGEVGRMQCHARDGKLVFTGASLQAREPCTMHGVLELAEDGSYSRYRAHVGRGTDAPRLTFEATYERQS